MKKSVLAAFLIALLPGSALAWGTNGHRMITTVAAEQLPQNVPAFVRTPEALYAMVQLAAEEDNIKGAGTSWDDDFDPGHFVDADDSGGIDGVVKLNALPESMDGYAKALAGAGKDMYREGYLPYSIMDGFERVRKDFAIWRVDAYVAKHAQSASVKQEYAKQQKLREVITIHDIGDWSHFVGDGSQPLHVTYHFNGWGEYPNPNGYSTSHHVHSMFESEFVNAHVKIADVRKHFAAYVAHVPTASLTQEQIGSLIGAYLTGSSQAVVPLYEMEKAGGFAKATPAAIDFTAVQLARGSNELRDLIALAWEDSINQEYGYPPIKVRDVLSGQVMPREQNG